MGVAQLDDKTLVVYIVSKRLERHSLPLDGCLLQRQKKSRSPSVSIVCLEVFEICHFKQKIKSC